MPLQVEMVQNGVDWGDAAGWAQAVATAVALWLALRQGWDAARRDRARDYAAASAVYTLVENASQTVVHMHSDLIAADGAMKTHVARRILDSGRLTELAHALDNFDVTRLPEKIFVTCLNVSQRSLRDFRQAVESIAHPPAVPLLIRDPWPPVDNLQRAQSMLVEPLLLLEPGAKWRVFKADVAQRWADLKRFREAG